MKEEELQPFEQLEQYTNRSDCCEMEVDGDATMDPNNEVVVVDDDDDDDDEEVAEDQGDNNNNNNEGANDDNNDGDDAAGAGVPNPPAPVFHTSRFPCRDLIQRGEYRAACTHLQTYPYEMTLCNASNYNILHDLAFRPAPHGTEEPLPDELVLLILAQGGAQSLLGDVNAAGYSTWHDVVCTQIMDPPRDRLLRLILTQCPHFVYDMPPPSPVGTPNAKHKTALEWFAQHWRRTMKGSSGRRLRRVLSQWDGMGYMDDLEIDKDEEEEENAEDSDQDVDLDDEDEDEYQFVPQTYNEHTTPAAAAAAAAAASQAPQEDDDDDDDEPGKEEETTGPFLRRFWSPQLTCLVERFKVLLEASSNAIVQPPRRPLYHQSVGGESPHSNSNNTSHWSLLLHILTCRCPLPWDFIRLVLQSGDLPPDAARQRNHQGELPLTLLLGSVVHFWSPQKKRALVGPLLTLLTRQFPGTAREIAATPGGKSLPLHWALKQTKNVPALSWHAELSLVVKDYPPAVEQRDAETRLYPFFLAARKLCTDNHEEQDKEKETRLVMDAAFELLRCNPALVIPQATSATATASTHKKPRKTPPPA